MALDYPAITAVRQ